MTIKPDFAPPEGSKRPHLYAVIRCECASPGWVEKGCLQAKGYKQLQLDRFFVVGSRIRYVNVSKGLPLPSAGFQPYFATADFPTHSCCQGGQETGELGSWRVFTRDSYRLSTVDEAHSSCAAILSTQQAKTYPLTLPIIVGPDAYSAGCYCAGRSNLSNLSSLHT